MKIQLTSFLLSVIFLMSLICSSADAGSREIQKVETAAEVLTEVMDIPEKSIPVSLLSDAYGIAVIPGVIKVGFVLGGRHGQGIMVTRTKSGNWGNPSFVTLTGGSIRWQIGAQSTDVILVFRSRRSIDGITRGKFTLGADASIAAGPVGRHAEAGTDIELKAEVFSYSRSRGLFAGIALEGTALQIDHDANEAFYNIRNITARDIFNNEHLKVPAVANKFKHLLEKYTK